MKSHVRESSANGLGTLRQQLLDNLDTRFGELEGKKLYAVATILDPRFKTAFFSNDQRKADAIGMLKEEYEKENQDLVIIGEQPMRKEKRATTGTHAFDFDSVAVDDIAVGDHDASEINDFLSHPRISSNNCPFAWWKDHHNSFPILSTLARRYLQLPPASVEEERIFSGTGKILEPARNRMLPKKAEMVAFLHYNLPAIDFNWKM